MQERGDDVEPVSEEQDSEKELPQRVVWPWEGEHKAELRS